MIVRLFGHFPSDFKHTNQTYTPLGQTSYRNKMMGKKISLEDVICEEDLLSYWWIIVEAPWITVSTAVYLFWLLRLRLNGTKDRSLTNLYLIPSKTLVPNVTNVPINIKCLNSTNEVKSVTITISSSVSYTKESLHGFENIYLR